MVSEVLKCSFSLHAPRVEWDTPHRSSVITLKAEGVSQLDIFKKTGVPPRTQARHIEKGPRRCGAKRIGRPTTLSDSDTQKVISHITRRYSKRVLGWELLAKDLDFKISGATLRRHMAKKGYHKCKACQKSWISEDQAIRRKDFADEMRRKREWYWKLVHFSDETHFHMNSRRTEWVIRNEKERHCPDCIQKKRKTASSQFHCWAMIAWNYKGPLIFYDMREQRNKEGKKGGGNITMEEYTTHLLPYVVTRKKEVESQGRHFIFQEDNDGGHGTRSQENPARFYKVLHNIDFIDDWPPNSPDLSPIESVWRILKQRVKTHKAMSKEQLQEAIQQEWARITIEEVNNCIFGAKYHVQLRHEQCYERNGYATQF